MLVYDKRDNTIKEASISSMHNLCPQVLTGYESHGMWSDYQVYLLFVGDKRLHKRHLIGSGEVIWPFNKRLDDITVLSMTYREQDRLLLGYYNIVPGLVDKRRKEV